MKITELKQNHKYRRPNWLPTIYIIFQEETSLVFYKNKQVQSEDFQLDYSDIISDDWEIISEKPKYPPANVNVLLRIKPKFDDNEDRVEWIKGAYSGNADSWIIHRLGATQFEVLDWKEE